MKNLFFTVAFCLAAFFPGSSYAQAQGGSAAPSATPVLDSAKLMEYAGTYKLDDNPFVPTVKAIVKDGTLYGQAEGYPEGKLIPVKTDEFTGESTGASIIFTRKDGKVTGIKVIAQGQELSGIKQAEVAVAAASPDSAALKEYSGSYKMADNPNVAKMIVTWKNGALVGQADSYPETTLIKVKGDEFTENAFNSTITFTRKDNKVTGLKISVQGMDMEGTKE